MEREKEIEARIKSLKLMLIKKAQKKGIYENFGQREVNKLKDVFGENSQIEKFEDWATNFDQSKLKKVI